jgi:hypothetical protein
MKQENTTTSAAAAMRSALREGRLGAKSPERKKPTAKSGAIRILSTDMDDRVLKMEAGPMEPGPIEPGPMLRADA